MKTKFKTSPKPQKHSILENRNFLNGQNYINDWWNFFYKNNNFTNLWVFILLIISLPILLLYFNWLYFHIDYLNNIMKSILNNENILIYILLFLFFYLIFIFTPKVLLIKYINLHINKIFIRKKILYLKPISILKNKNYINNDINKYILKK
jgi:hypothetical protein